ncbi:sensor histidine kinase [Solimonas sp. K1W22B-7]|uniref:sensor histidine kinase n=1 Tax=Solimonas sp. K1W22B-7 TaxID=2303331 RepID=UPI000E334D10|nr:HAMP domain-containing sensor histidine kinase [Solimonas sp. K1W22B-7]AXQ28703.1 sensor histidine kinase [Solimonas sp. K1W22B-7]
MSLRLPLYLRALLLLALNLLVLAVLLIGWAGWGSLLSPAARERLGIIGELISNDLSQAPQAQWPQILAAYSERYGVGFSTDGPKSGPGGPGGPPPGEGRGPPPRMMDGPPHGMGRGGPPPRFGGPGDRLELRQAGIGGPYGIVIPTMVTTEAGRRPLDIRVDVPSVYALAVFLGVGEWLRLALIAVGLSALVWAPFFFGIARAVVRMKLATRRIAAGRFESRLPDERRGDELGQLAGSINDMAGRLQHYVSSQKQFLADVAHETISPLARMQIGLGLLESRVGDDARETLQDVQDDARQMSELLNELLLFSRAGMEADRAAPERIELRPLLAEAIDREALSQVEVAVAAGLAVRGQRALLLRALSNLLRNAARHGGGSAIAVAAERAGGELSLWVRDSGPGVPEAALPRLGQPFFRPDAARSRERGGHGLGLAIVRRCVEACEGSLHFRNRIGGGFEAELRLPAAD